MNLIIYMNNSIDAYYCLFVPAAAHVSQSGVKNWAYYLADHVAEF
jgi:hypothetical protein